MQERGGGGRCHHSAEQPGVERHLSRLGDAGERQCHRRQGGKRRSHDAGGDELHERERVHSQRDGEQRHQKADTSSQVHDDLAKRVVDGLRRFGVTDEQKRAHRGDLPAGEHPQQVVGEHDDVHGGEEQEHEGEKLRTAILGIGRLMSLKILHIAQSVDADAAADDADDERSDQRKAIQVQPILHFDAMGDEHVEHQRAHNLHHGKHACQYVLVLHAEAQDDRGDDQADERAYDIDRT